MLAFTDRAAAREVEKLLRSAVSNAEANHGLIGDDLVVKTVFVDAGPVIKRWRAAAAAVGPDPQADVSHHAHARPGRRRRPSRAAPPPQGEAEARAAPKAAPKAKAETKAAETKAEAKPKAKPKAATPKKKAPAKKKRATLMGQKVHPGGMRVGVIHDWKSNWYTGTKEFPGALLEDIKIREHIYAKLSHAGLSDVLIRKDKQRITIDIYTARPGIVIGKSGAEVDALRKEIHGMTAQERPHQHQRDQAPRARREARRAVDRRAAPEPGQLPARDEALARLGDALGRPRREGAVRRPARRHAR